MLRFMGSQESDTTEQLNWRQLSVQMGSLGTEKKEETGLTILSG